MDSYRVLSTTAPGFPHLHPDQIKQLEGKPWPRKYVFADLDFPFMMFDQVGHPELGLHTHEDFSELVVVHHGRGIHITEVGEYPISAGDVFFVTGELAHGYRDVDDLWVLDVVYDTSFMLRGMQDISRVPGYFALFHLEPRYRRQHWFESRLHLPPDRLDQLLDMLEDVSSTVRLKAPGYEFRTRLQFLEVVCFLCEQYANSPNPATRSLILMDDIIHFIESNYAEPITLQELTQRAGMAERTLHLLFNEATGVSPIEYLIRTRVARASDMLRTTRLTITEIAFRSGFQDSNYFARQFKRITGMTASDYRRRYTRESVMPA